MWSAEDVEELLSGRAHRTATLVAIIIFTAIADRHGFCQGGKPRLVAIGTLAICMGVLLIIIAESSTVMTRKR